MIRDNLPTFNNISELSLILNLSEITLYSVSKNSDKFYKEILIPKKDGSMRTLACPSSKLKAIQAWILRNILEKIQVANEATAFIKDRSIYQNLEHHIGNDYFLCVDLKDFFPSVKRKRVVNFFLELGYSMQASMLLSNFCTYNGGLPQGGVTSPTLSNIIARDLDRKIASYCIKRDVKYTRYADDITLSAKEIKKLELALRAVRRYIKEEGFVINNKKTRFLRPGASRRITGLVYSENQEIGIGRKQKRILRSKIFNLEFVVQMNTEEHKELQSHIDGWMSFLYGTDRNAYDQLYKYWVNLRLKKENSLNQVAATLEN